MFVHDRFLQSARTHRDRVALWVGRASWTYAELARRSLAVAQALRASGLQTGDRVALDLGNQAAAVPALWGALLAGGAFVFLDSTTPRQRFVELLRDFRPHALLTRADRLRELSAGDLPRAVWTDGDGERSLSAVFCCDAGDLAPPTLDDGALASLVYTSGSTGFPKGVMMTHRSMGAAVTAITTYLRSADQDVVLCLLPLSFDYGHYQVLMTGATGGCLVLEPGFGYPGTLLQVLRERQVTTLPGVPTVFALLLQLKTFQAQELPHLRTFTNTGAAVPVPHVRALRERFPSARLYLMYGLTECKRVSYLPPEVTDAFPGSVGIAMPGCEVEVIDGEGRPLPPHQVGELVVRGPNLMAGYWERPEATARALRHGPWPQERCLYTGDRFHKDENGYLYFHGRDDDVFKCRGEKVAPAEVEAVLHSMPGVVEAAVIGAEHPVLGHAVVAYVVPAAKGAVSVSEVRSYCAKHLESYKVPHEVHLVDALVHNARGKIDRATLRGGHLSQERS